jgi:hypothetical protein
VYADAKFTLGLLSTKFSAADYFGLSRMPNFFDDGSTQQLLLGYNALQACCFQYVAERGGDWYEHMLTTDQVDYSETLTAISIPSTGTTQRTSKDRHVVTYYANANQAAKLFATGSTRSVYNVQYLKYYVDGSRKKINTFSELYSIPGKRKTAIEKGAANGSPQRD